jgi:hypothetical protein
MVGFAIKAYLSKVIYPLSHETRVNLQAKDVLPVYHICQIIMDNLSNISDKNIYFDFKKRLKNLHSFLLFCFIY